MDLGRLAGLVEKAEAGQDFAAAAQIWGQIQQLMSGKFGEDAWQSQNAKLAHKTAYAKSQFDSDQLAKWKNIENLQLSINQSLKAHRRRCFMRPACRQKT